MSSIPGRYLLTRTVAHLPVPTLSQLIKQVAEYSQFEPGNDPYEEHDFGTIELQSERFYWKIDYFDRELCNGSPNPADLDQTLRVLTVMHASEY